MDNILQYSANVLTSIQEAISLRESHRAHDIESEILDPLAEIYDDTIVYKFVVERFP